MAEQRTRKGKKRASSLRSGLPPLQVADLPPKTQSFWQLVGPAAILVGLSIGSGEFIMWPRLTAQYGAGMSWVAVAGVFLQFWVNQELGRYTLATGESVYAGFARMWRGFTYFFIFINVASWILPGWAVASGQALKTFLVGIEGWGEPYVWTWITFGLIAFLLFGPKRIYRTVELAEMMLVALITLGLIAVAFTVANWAHWKELLSGLAAIRHLYIHPDVPAPDLFAAIVFAGAGGTGNIFINYYLRDKNLGMGSRIPEIVNPIRAKAEKVPSTGFTFPDDEDNARYWRLWFRHLRQEQALVFFGLNTLTILLFIIGSLAVLRPKGLVPQGFEVAVVQAEILNELLGEPGRRLFLIVAFATLFSTQLSLVDGNARTLSDLVYVNFESFRQGSLSFWYAAFAIFWILAGCLLSLFRFTPLMLLITSSCLGGIAMALYCPLTLIINHKMLPRCARPDGLSTLMLVIATSVYGGFTLWLLWTLLR